MKNKRVLLSICLVFGLIKPILAIDTLSYYYKSIKKESKVFVSEQKDTIQSTFELRYPVFKHPAWNDLLKKLILEGKYPNYEAFAQAFISEAETANTEEEEFARPWYGNLSIKVLPQLPATQTLSFEFFDDQYTGGAHPNTIVEYVNFDVFSRKSLSKADLIQPSMMARFAYLASTIFRKQEGLSPTQSLENYFFENQKFSLNSNFLITKKGLLFYYNSYEIRSYAEGPMELLVPYTAISGLLKINPYIPKNLK
jgi:hypothetical protein